jgi:hypothetical protein
MSGIEWNRFCRQSQRTYALGGKTFSCKVIHLCQ